MESKNKVKKFINKMIFLIVCIVLSIAFSYGLKTYIDYQGIRINEEVPLGDTTCPANQFYLAGKCNECPSGMTSSAGSVGAASCKCPAGKYKSGSRTCKTCPTNSYCPAGSVTFKSCPNGKISLAGSDSSYDCYCPSGTKEDSAGKCVPIEECKIKSLSFSYGYITKGKSVNANVTLSGDNCSGKTLSATISNGTLTYDTLNVTNNVYYTFNVSTSNSTACNAAVISVTLSGGETRTASVSVRPQFRLYKTGSWKAENILSEPKSSTAADLAKVDYYYSDRVSCGDKYCYTKYYARSCGGSIPLPPSTPTESKACYKTSTGEYKWDTKKSGYTLVEGIEKEVDCKKPEIVDVSICKEKETFPKKSIKEATCDGNVNFVDDVTKSCSFETSENDFYKITCNEKLSANLNPSNTGTIRLGLGFSYDVNISTIRTCKGEFDANKFKEAYNKVLENINKAQDNSAEKKTNEKKLEELKKILNKYNKWESNYNLNSITAKLNDNQLNTNINFIKKEEKGEKGNKVKTSDNKLGISGLTNPIDFTYTEKLTKTLILPTAYYNTNKIVYNKCDGCVKLSNQYYISDNRNYINTDYKYTVTISGLGFNQSWSIKTKDCSLKVMEDEIIYRPTDVNDPFLNNANPNRPTGKNWKNDLFDFTGIIDEDIWSEKSLYEFNITNQNVKEIKKNNSDLGANAYLGIDCKLITTTNRYYCEFLRNDRYFNYHYIYRDNIH